MADHAMTIHDTFDFRTPVETTILPPFMVAGDNSAHRIAIACRDGGADADLSGLQCTCVIVNAKNKTITFDGAIDGNNASILLTNECYLVPGPIDINIKLITLGFSTTIYKAKSVVLGCASGDIFNPGGKVSLEELIALRAAFDEAMVSIDAIIGSQDSRFISVLDYGADPLGVNDSGAAINAAIDYAVDNGYTNVYIPAGTYVIETAINWKSDIRIYGTKKTTILKIKAGADINCIESSAEVHYGCIEDITIDGSADVNAYGSGGTAVKAWVHQSQIKNVFAYNIAGSALDLNGNDGVSTHFGYFNVIRDCNFPNCGNTAIKWGRYIRDSWLAYTSASAIAPVLFIAGTSCKFIGNNLSGGTNSIYLNAANNHTFLGNVLENAGTHAIYAKPVNTEDVCYSCLFANNVIRNCSADAHGTYDAFHLEGHAALAMRNMLISGNMIANNQANLPRYPVYVLYGDNITVNDNLFDGYTETLPVYEEGVYNSVIRYQKSKNEYVNVVDHGADRYGVNDSGAAINAAIDYAVNKGYQKVYIPEGLYTIETPIQPRTNLKIFGDGKLTILKIKTGADINCIEPGGEVHYGQLCGFTIDGSADVNTYVTGGSAIKTWGHTCIFYDLFTYNVARHQLELNWDDSISGNTGYLNIVDRCQFLQSEGTAIMWGWRATDSWIRDCNVGSETADVELEGNTIRFMGCHFDGNPEYNILARRGANHVLISGCIIENAKKHGLYFQRPVDTCPAGISYYADTALTTLVDVTAEELPAVYGNDAYSSLEIAETTYYVATSDCNGNPYDNLSVIGNIIRSCGTDAVSTYDMVRIEGHDEDAKATNIIISGNQFTNVNDPSVTLPRYCIVLKWCDNAQVSGNVYDQDGYSATYPILVENTTGEIKDQMVYRGEVKTQQEINNHIAAELSHLAPGRDLSGIFSAFSTVAAKIGDGSFEGIRICDYWDVSLTGTYRDYARESCPAGVTYYSDTALTTSVDVTTETVDATYVNAVYCSIQIGGTTYYVATGDCNGYKEMSVTGAQFRGQFAAFKPYMRSIGKGHAVICGLATFPNRTAMRKASNVWEASGEVTPWLGSALYRTLNDPDYGIIRLFDGTAFENYIYPGTSGNGMNLPMERKPYNAWSADNVITDGRGALFVPLEYEVFGCHARSSAAYGLGYVRQWELFKDCQDTIAKLEGGTTTYNSYWLASAKEGTPTEFCAVSSDGTPISAGDSANWYSVPICFVVAVP